MPTNSSPFRRAGRTIGRFRLICATNARSIPHKLDVHDPSIKAAFAEAPGIIKAFGMDEAGLARMTIPAYVTVGARDTQTPPTEENAAFAAKHIPGARLVIIPGLVDHEIFVNECDDEGRDEFPEARSCRASISMPSTRLSAAPRSNSLV